MKYSLDEIDRMRAALNREIIAKEGLYYSSRPSDAQALLQRRAMMVEYRLRTLMVSGVTVEEVEDKWPNHNVGTSTGGGGEI